MDVASSICRLGQMELGQRNDSADLALNCGCSAACLFSSSQLPQHAPPMQFFRLRTVYGVCDQVQIFHGFEEALVGAQSRRSIDGFDGYEPGQHDDLNPTIELLDLLQQFQTTFAWHLNIEDYNLRCLLR